MAISISDVDYVAKLAKLHVSEEEKQAAADKLGAILNYMEELRKIDTEGVAPTTHVLPMENVFREDTVKACLSKEEALSGAPETEDGYFKIPRIF